MKILNRIITFVTTVFVIIACIVFAATAICKIGNIEPRIVLSGSMEPKIHTGSICFINKKVPYDKIKTIARTTDVSQREQLGRDKMVTERFYMYLHLPLLILALRQREMPIKYQMGFLLTKQTTGVKQSYLFHMPDILVCIYRVRVGKLFLSV